MPNIVHEVTIEAQPATIYEALTQEKGLQAWWTAESQAEAKVGSTAHFKFYGGQVHFQFNVDTLESDKKVEWSVKSAVPGWENTRITWELSEGENGTTLTFGHHDFASYDPPFGMTNFNWGWYLTSLKEYAETGTGRPHANGEG